MSELDRLGENLALSYQAESGRPPVLLDAEPTTYVTPAILFVGADVHIVSAGQWDSRLVLTRDGSGWHDAFLERAASGVQLAPWRDGLDAEKRFLLYAPDGQIVVAERRHYGPLELQGGQILTARPDPDSGALVRYPFAHLDDDGWHLAADWGGRGPGALVVRARLGTVDQPRALLAPAPLPAPGHRQRLSPLAERMCDTLLT